MAALVVHASKEGESRRMLYTKPVIAGGEGSEPV
jgi:hypothetical protein